VCAQLERKKDAMPTCLWLNLKERRKSILHFYDFEVDAQGRLMHVLWADATSKKIISILVMWYLSIRHIPPTNIT
jgi:hypothetical protein